MPRLLVTLVFIASIAGNSLAGANPHFNSDSDCSGSCCRTARMKAIESVAASLCCLVDCNQPGENNSSSIKGVASRRGKESSTLSIVQPESGRSNIRTRFTNLPIIQRVRSTARYLETCSLLI